MHFGSIDGQDITLITLESTGGLKAEIFNYGATVRTLEVPVYGHRRDITSGFETFEEYVSKSPYFGCVVGRFGNRIADGKFELNGQSYQLETNETANGHHNHLHGGKTGLDKRIWSIEGQTAHQVQFRYHSPDGEGGYPGDLECWVTYTLQDLDWVIEYELKAHDDTIHNLTNHAYFNLDGSESCLQHKMQLDASSYLPINEALIPTGEIASVEGTPFDFRTPKTIAPSIQQSNDQIEIAGGFDHSWVIDGQAGELRRAAVTEGELGDLVMETWTTEPCVQFYSGNFLPGGLNGKGGASYAKQSAFCLESQHHPNAINTPHFPSVVLRRGETYRSKTTYRFINK